MIGSLYLYLLLYLIYQIGKIWTLFHELRNYRFHSSSDNIQIKAKTGREDNYHSTFNQFNMGHILIARVGWGLNAQEGSNKPSVILPCGITPFTPPSWIVNTPVDVLLMCKKLRIIYARMFEKKVQIWSTLSNYHKLNIPNQNNPIYLSVWDLKTVMSADVSLLLRILEMTSAWLSRRIQGRFLPSSARVPRLLQHHWNLNFSFRDRGRKGYPNYPAQSECPDCLNIIHSVSEFGREGAGGLATQALPS